MISKPGRPGKTGVGFICALRIILPAAAVLLPGVSVAQDSLPPQTREVRKFSLFFEANETVELELTTDHPEEIRKNRFLKFELFDGRSLVAGSQFNLASLPIVKVTAIPTGYGKAKININGHAGELVSVRNNRVRLFGQISIHSVERDPESGQLILIPDPTNFKGLTTIVDKDGGRRTLMLVMTTSIESVAK